jgi:ferredoxin-NADP reductase
MWYQGEIINILDETPNVKRFWLEVQDVTQFEFRAGQFVTFDLPIGEKRLQRWRSYSIASSPDGSNVIELCIVRLENGLGTRFFFEAVTIGTLLKFKGPDGTFYLPDTLDKEIVMVCTGTGVAPFRSMILDKINQKKLTSKIHLIFGCRTAQDILYRQEFETLASQHADFQYDITLSRENLLGLHHGYVQEVFKKTYVNLSKNRKFYLCGWSKMIDEAVANLVLEMGYDRTQILYELYG